MEREERRYPEEVELKDLLALRAIFRVSVDLYEKLLESGRLPLFAKKKLKADLTKAREELEEVELEIEAREAFG